MRIVWKHFPLVSIHANAQLSALASTAAAEQGKFWEFHDKVFAAQNKMNKAQYLAYAQQLGMDVKKFESAIDSARGKSLVDADMNEAKSLGVGGTPAFFVNGRFLNGAKPLDEFAQVINAELTRLKLPIPPAAQQAAGAPAGGPAGS